MAHAPQGARGDAIRVVVTGTDAKEAMSSIKFSVHMSQRIHTLVRQASAALFELPAKPQKAWR